MIAATTALEFRTALISDAPRLARIFAASWAHAYRGIIPEPTLSHTIDVHDTVWWRRALNGSNPILIFEVAGELGGYATYGPSRGARAGLGEIYELYLAPEYQGLGHGTDLFEAARARLDLQWSNGLVVWVLSKNRNALEFYAKLGGRSITTRNFGFNGVSLEKSLLAWDLPS